MHLAAILFTGPVRQMFFVTFDYFNTVVGAASINDDVLKRFLSLI